jgi:hypothetical protein
MILIGYIPDLKKFMNNEEFTKEQKIEIIKEISPTFCLAKWHHSTIYLQLGQTHSCYHPPPHEIPLDELLENPSALHNTNQKKKERYMMLDGEKPSGCQYCWNIEKLGDGYKSDRDERNENIFTIERIEEIKKSPRNFNINPEYIEISFGNECNFKCGYCHPKYSSSYYKEIKDHGPYTMVKNHRNDIDWFKIYEEENNPYVEAWWRWWPEVSKTLHILRITGGEPLLQKSTWRLFESLTESPMPKLGLNINSNFGVKPVLVQRFVKYVNDLINDNKIREFKLFTSIDTWGPQAEYIRTGLDLKVWENNFNSYMLGTDAPVTFMITFNILTVTNFKNLLEKILEWRLKYTSDDSGRFRRIGFDTPHLKEPLQYDMNLLPKKEFMPYMYDSLEFMRSNCNDSDKLKFSNAEVEKFARVVKYMETSVYPEDRLKEGRRDFYNWFNEYDRRRGTDFSKTFPELTQFFEDCGKLTKITNGI